MKFAFILSKENLDLSVAEALTITQKTSYQLIDNVLILDLARNKKILTILAKRLAFTKSINQVLFICKKTNLIKNMKKFPWKTAYKKDFALRTHNNKIFQDKDLANYIFNNIKNPKVNLSNPNSEIEMFFTKNQIIATLKKIEIHDDYELRKAQNRPASHPSSMHPRWAKALVNLTGIREGKLLDPMCGSGGFLIEAGLMGISTIGYDIEKEMLKRAKINIEYFKLKNIILKQSDATKNNQKFNFIVTDLPYGKNTKQQDMLELYTNFFKNLNKILKKRAVVIGPSFLPVKKLIQENTNLKIKYEFSQYIHATLTRNIFVLEN